MLSADWIDTVRVTGTMTSLSPGAESFTLPVYAVAEGERLAGFTDTIRAPLVSDADSQVPPAGVVTTGVTLTGRADRRA